MPGAQHLAEVIRQGPPPKEATSLGRKVCQLQQAKGGDVACVAIPRINRQQRVTPGCERTQPCRSNRRRQQPQARCVEHSSEPCLQPAAPEWSALPIQ